MLIQDVYGLLYKVLRFPCPGTKQTRTMRITTFREKTFPRVAPLVLNVPPKENARARRTFRSSWRYYTCANNAELCKSLPSLSKNNISSLTLGFFPSAFFPSVVDVACTQVYCFFFPLEKNPFRVSSRWCACARRTQHRTESNAYVLSTINTCSCTILYVLRGSIAVHHKKW